MSASDVVRGHVPVSSAWDWFTALPTWQLKAACKGMGPDAFYGSRSDGDNALGTEAKAVCAQCPTIAECLDYSLTLGDNQGQYGIWGGCGESDRRLFATARHARTHDDPREVPGCECRWCELFRLHLRRLDGESIPLRADFARMTHGRRVTYARGCRCRRCTFAASSWGQRLAVARVDTAAFYDLHAGEWMAGAVVALGSRVDDDWREAVVVRAAAFELVERMAALFGFMSGLSPVEVRNLLRPLMDQRVERYLEPSAKAMRQARTTGRVASEVDSGKGRNLAA